MQRILNFEIAMAIKDRPKVFQIITLVLFAFSLTVVLIGSVLRLSATEKSRYAFGNQKVNHYAGFVSSPVKPVMDLQK